MCISSVIFFRRLISLIKSCFNTCNCFFHIKRLLFTNLFSSYTPIFPILYSSPIFANLAAWSAVISKCLYFVGCTHIPISSDFPIKAIHKHLFLKDSIKNEVLQQSATILHFFYLTAIFTVIWFQYDALN